MHLRLRAQSLRRNRAASGRSAWRAASQASLREQRGTAAPQLCMSRAVMTTSATADGATLVGGSFSQEFRGNPCLDADVEGVAEQLQHRRQLPGDRTNRVQQRGDRDADAGFLGRLRLRMRSYTSLRKDRSASARNIVIDTPRICLRAGGDKGCCKTRQMRERCLQTADQADMTEASGAYKARLRILWPRRSQRQIIGMGSAPPNCCAARHDVHRTPVPEKWHATP